VKVRFLKWQGILDFQNICFIYFESCKSWIKGLQEQRNAFFSSWSNGGFEELISLILLPSILGVVAFADEADQTLSKALRIRYL